MQPILEKNCLSCHSAEKSEGGLNLTTRSTAFTTGNSPPAIVPNKPEDSPLYTRTTLAKDDSTLMPPTKQGGPLDQSATETLRHWIAEGANWPKDVVLKTRRRNPPAIRIRMTWH